MKEKSSHKKLRAATVFQYLLIGLLCLQMVNISVNTPNNVGLGFVKNDVENVLELVLGNLGDCTEDIEASAGTVVCAEEEVVHLFHKNLLNHCGHNVDSFSITHKSSDKVIDLNEHVSDITPPPPKRA